MVIIFVYFKAKDTYHARCFEFEKLKRENANQRDCERAEVKMKKARMLTFFALLHIAYYFTTL